MALIMCTIVKGEGCEREARGQHEEADKRKFHQLYLLHITT